MAWPALIVVLLDQISKLAIVYTLRLHESVPVIPGFFDLVHVRNRGMAFGLMNHSGSEIGFYFLIPATLAAIILLLIWLFRLKKAQAPIALGLSLILGGAVGNLIDRIRFREVIDFLDFYLGSYHWPAFNVADSAITVGTFWVAFFLVFRQQSPSILKS
jgi:signal peptidase II